MTDATGDRPRDEQEAWFTEEAVETSSGELTDTARYEGNLEGPSVDDVSAPSGSDHLELLTELELRADETSDPNEAAEEGLAYVPPMDPPVVPSDDPEGIAVAAGFGVSALDEPYDEDHHDDLLSGEGEVNDLVREALRADASTSRWADQIVIGVRGSTVVLRGLVDDVEDSDNVVAVAERVSGVTEVIDQIEVRALA